MAVTRLINAHRTEIQKMTAAQLKESIWLSEGRVVLSQNFVGMSPLCMGVTNPELAQAMGADMIMFNGYSLNDQAALPGLAMASMVDGQFTFEQKRLLDMQKYVDIPMGVYLECGGGGDLSNVIPGMDMKYRMPTRENLEKLVKEKSTFVVMGGNPGTGVTYDSVLTATKDCKRIVGDDMLIFAGKWEDGAKEPVIGDPIKPLSFYKEFIAALIDAGADVIGMPMPGSRWGSNVADNRELITFAHTYKAGTLTMSFLDGTIEGSDVDTVRECGLLSKQTGADIHAIGDAGLCGMSIPENIHQLSITIKGRAKTWERMAISRR